MSEEDAFDQIINSNGLTNFMKDAPERAAFTVQEVHEGVSSLSESSMYLMDFLVAVLEADRNNSEVPEFTTESILAMKQMFTAAKHFCDSLDEDEENGTD